MGRWLAYTGRAALHVLAGVALAGVTVFVVMVLFVTWIGSVGGLAQEGLIEPGWSLLFVLPIVLNPFILWWALDRLGDLQRSRFRRILRHEIATPPQVLLGDVFGPRAGDSIPDRVRLFFRPWRTASTYRQFLYHVCGAAISVAGAAALVFCCVAWPVALTDQRGSWLVVAGPALLVAVPWVARGFAAADLAVARALLGPTRNQQLTLRVETLARSRADVVAATDAERRRIERDLHDGPQQRLVSLAMNLGVARANLTDAAPAVQEAIASAHDEALEALTELRHLVRGLHPAVLNDRGLDAALSGIAARAPVPVQLTVDVPIRCSPSIEAIAYFVVSEALTNVAKHAQATRAHVTVERIGDQLFVSVTDDGRGGARPMDLDGLAGGSGLRGLGRRAAAVDGTLAIHSPYGGPTAITVVLPCES